VIIVENGSSDNTLEIAEKLAADLPRLRVIAKPWADYGGALAAGFEAAQGETVVNFDVDYYDVDFLERAEKMATEVGAAIVVASKTAPGAVDKRPLLRRVLTAGFTTVLKTGFGMPVSDAHGMKLMRRAAVRPIAEVCKMRGSLFDVELVLRAGKAGLVVAEIPAIVEERRPPRTAVWRRSLEAMHGLVKLRALLWREARGAGAANVPASSGTPAHQE
jgi:glycosyltransferase involved in cell wall biosynthesis